MINTDKLFQRIQSVIDAKNDKPCVVLLSTGAYCPPHNAHIDVFVKAKKGLEEKHGFNVVAAYLSPSHDSYVKPKLNSSGVSAIPATHRIAMVRVATADADFLEVSEWEAAQSGFADFPEVARHHTQYLSTQVRQKFGSRVSRHLKVFYLCGSDHAYKCGLMRRQCKFCDGLVVLRRPGTAIQGSSLPSNVYVVDDPTQALSSTMVRNKIMKGESIAEFVHPKVVAYIKDNNITIKRTR